jgi:PPOX class F420-dependent enzyme/OxyR family protein
MTAFTEVELAYLATQRLGRLATVGRHGAPHVMPVGFRLDAETDTIVIGGHGMGGSKKWRDIGRDPRVALVVDDVQPPWSPRLVEVRGVATRFTTGGAALGRGFDEEFVRITPLRVITYGLGAAGHDRRTFEARDVHRRDGTTDRTIEELVTHLRLEPLPLEGGLFRQTWVGEERDGRPLGTAIVVLLAAHGGHFSAMHRLPIDEVWFFQAGDPIELLLLQPGTPGRVAMLGPDVLHGAELQVVVRAGTWMGARTAPGGAWSLFATSMAPGFVPADYDPGDGDQLSAAWPQHESLVRALTRS